MDADQERLLEELFQQFVNPDPEVFRPAMHAVAGAGAAFDRQVASAMIGRLATLGANPDLPQANDALRALRALEDNIGPHAPGKAPERVPSKRHS